MLLLSDGLTPKSDDFTALCAVGYLSDSYRFLAPVQWAGGLAQGVRLVTDDRKTIQAAAQAALWAISNGKCYAPGCPFPVLVEVRSGVYQKNAQIAHIYGVKPTAARYNAMMSVDRRDSFSNLLLLCLAHHAEVDDKKNGSRLYPAEKLLKWKADHEGRHASVLAAIGPVDTELLMEQLAAVFEPPAKRLEAIADQLEKTGRLNASSLAELHEITSALSDNSGVDLRTVAMLTDAVNALGGHQFSMTVAQLTDAANTYAQAVHDQGRYM